MANFSPVLLVCRSRSRGATLSPSDQDEVLVPARRHIWPGSPVQSHERLERVRFATWRT
jgi:hypothetical protein